MTRSMAMRMVEMLRERGLSCSMGIKAPMFSREKPDAQFSVIWWDAKEGLNSPEHVIDGSSLAADQHWMEREVIK